MISPTAARAAYDLAACLHQHERSPSAQSEARIAVAADELRAELTPDTLSPREQVMADALARIMAEGMPSEGDIARAALRAVDAMGPSGRGAAPGPADPLPLARVLEPAADRIIAEVRRIQAGLPTVSQGAACVLALTTLTEAERAIHTLVWATEQAAIAAAKAQP